MDKELMMDRELLKEILAALTGTTVKEHTEPRGENSVHLTTDNFLKHTLLPALRATEQKTVAVPPEMHVKLDEFHDLCFDYDFRNFSGTITCERGGEKYTRPRGWYRYALKVLGKYPGGDAWLGSDGWRDYSVDGEWPVSFHGTSLEGAEGIVEDHYRAGPRDKYGRGIYSTPIISEAEKYTCNKQFNSKNGKRYEIMLQNRINPKYRKICEKQDYWLVPIPKGTSPKEEEDIVEKAIRPYGILVKEV